MRLGERSVGVCGNYREGLAGTESVAQHDVLVDAGALVLPDGALLAPELLSCLGQRQIERLHGIFAQGFARHDFCASHLDIDGAAVGWTLPREVYGCACELS